MEINKIFKDRRGVNPGRDKMSKASGIRVRRTKSNGVNLIELTLVIAVSGMLMLGITKMFKSSSDIWTSSLHSINIQQSGRAAVEEMTRFIRQSSAPVSNITPSIGNIAASISFEYMQDTSTIKSMEYFFKNSSLFRVANGATSTMIDGYVDSIYFNRVSTYIVKIQTFTLTKGTGRNRKTLTFERTINIRNR